METVDINLSKTKLSSCIDKFCKGEGLVITDDENLCKAAASKGLQVLPYK
jgi:hypothetical protein